MSGSILTVWSANFHNSLYAAFNESFSLENTGDSIDSDANMFLFKTLFRQALRDWWRAVLETPTPISSVPLEIQESLLLF